MTVWDTKEEFEAYKREHPGYNPDLHSVKSEKPGKSKKKAPDVDIDSPNDPVSPRKPPSAAVESAVKGDTGPVGKVVRDVKNKKWPTRGEVSTALAQVGKAMAEESSSAHLKQMKELTQFLTDLLGTTEEEEAPAIRPQRKTEKGPQLNSRQKKLLQKFIDSTSKADAKSTSDAKKKQDAFEKERESVLNQLDKFDLGEADMSGIQEHAAKQRKEYQSNKAKYDAAKARAKKERKPFNGSPPKEPDFQAAWNRDHPKDKIPAKLFEQVLGLPEKLSEPKKKEKKENPAEIRREFLKSVTNPEDKKRFDEMDEGEFMDAVKFFRSKQGSLRTSVIRLAYTRPDLREHLLRALGGV